jgi:hypothetical protein
MRQHACHHPDSKEVDAELLRRAALSTRHIGDVMQRNVHVLTQTATLLDAARALCTGAFRSLPIIAADGRLVGIVTSTDVIQALADDLQRAGVGTATPNTARPPPSSEDVCDPQVHALLELYRAVRNYLSSGQAEIERTRLLRAADRARSPALLSIRVHRSCARPKREGSHCA